MQHLNLDAVLFKREMKAVMELANSQSIVTLKAAQKKLKENTQRTSYILRELTLKGKLTKQGRGQTATYKKSKK